MGRLGVSLRNILRSQREHTRLDYCGVLGAQELQIWPLENRGGHRRGWNRVIQVLRTRAPHKSASLIKTVSRIAQRETGSSIHIAILHSWSGRAVQLHFRARFLRCRTQIIRDHYRLHETLREAYSLVAGSARCRAGIRPRRASNCGRVDRKTSRLEPPWVEMGQLKALTRLLLEWCPHASCATLRCVLVEWVGFHKWVFMQSCVFFAAQLSR